MNSCILNLSQQVTDHGFWKSSKNFTSERSWDNELDSEDSIFSAVTDSISSCRPTCLMMLQMSCVHEFQRLCFKPCILFKKSNQAYSNKLSLILL